MKINRYLLTTMVCALTLSTSALAEWKLDNAASRLSFVSIKATDIGEVHEFKQLNGSLSPDGELEVLIDLASVETLIPIRNERMAEFVFNTELFPVATITADIDPGALRSLGFGEVQKTTAKATLSLKDKKIEVETELLAIKAGDDKLVVASLKPIMMTASSLGLVQEVEKLRELAILPNISQAVPVSYVLTFRQN